MRIGSFSGQIAESRPRPKLATDTRKTSAARKRSRRFSPQKDLILLRRSVSIGKGVIYFYGSYKVRRNNSTRAGFRPPISRGEEIRRRAGQARLYFGAPAGFDHSPGRKRPPRQGLHALFGRRRAGEIFGKAENE